MYAPSVVEPVTIGDDGTLRLWSNPAATFSLLQVVAHLMRLCVMVIVIWEPIGSGPKKQMVVEIGLVLILIEVLIQ